MNELTFDTENTGATNGTKAHPFTPSNRCCVVGVSLNGEPSSSIPIEYSNGPYGEHLERFRKLVKEAKLLIGFNIKYDLHWIKRYGVSFRHCNVWDTQLAHFILSRHKNILPSLDQVADSWDLGRKLDIVRTRYWENGIDTDGVPYDTLTEYCNHDVDLTYQIYQKQKAYLSDKPQLRKSIWMACQDLLTTQEMEYNGLKGDFEQMQKEGLVLRSQIGEIDRQLQTFVNLPVDLNWSSGDHLSAFLYGGVVKKKERESYIFTYKDGHTAEKQRWIVKEYQLPRLVDPLPKTELAKEGYYETSHPVIQQLPKKGVMRQIIPLLFKRAELEQRASTYYEGWQILYKKMMWENGIVHGNLNHCIAATSRLSSSKPNQQNIDKEFLKCIITRF